jgi:gas vesicle protein
MTKDSDQLREEIAATRTDLSSNVNALADSVKPGNVARRQVDKVRDAAITTKDKIMGSVPDLYSAKQSAGSTVGDAKASVGSAASSAGDAVAGSPELVRSKTQGNPLAAGIIAFGAGLLVASLIPASEREQQAAAGLKENVEPLKDEVTAAAKQVAEHLREPAQDAVASVKQTATDAVQNTKDEGSSAAASVKSEAGDAVGTVRNSRS